MGGLGVFAARSGGASSQAPGSPDAERARMVRADRRARKNKHNVPLDEERRASWGFADNAEMFRRLIGSRLPDVIHFRRGTGEEYDARVEDIIHHLLTHGYHHRGQLAAHLRPGLWRTRSHSASGLGPGGLVPLTSVCSWCILTHECNGKVPERGYSFAETPAAPPATPVRRRSGAALDPRLSP